MDSFVYKQNAGLFGTAWPLVSAAGVEVGLNVGKIDIQQSETLSTVYQRDYLLFSCHTAKFFGGEEVSHCVAQMRKGEDAGAGRHGFFKRFQVVVETGVRIQRRNFLNDEAKSFTSFFPRLIVTGVVIRKDYYFITGFQIESIGDPIVGLAGVTRDKNLLRGHFQVFGQLFACMFFNLSHLCPVARYRFTIEALSVIVNGLKNRRRGGAEIGSI